MQKCLTDNFIGRNVAQKRPNTYNKAPSKSIPRPNGQAGRKRGFNLQNILGMDENKNKYNLFLVRIIDRLSLSNSIPQTSTEYYSAPRYKIPRSQAPVEAARIRQCCKSNSTSAWLTYTTHIHD